jgi:CDP-glycerol glycerophosphotransferase
VALEVARRRETWDAILAPDVEAADAYRREFDYTGTVLTCGSPRCDALVGADRDHARRAVLEGMGLSPEATVVLYAPTYRDAFSNRVTTAGLHRGLELERLVERLGPDHVVLLRAHPYDRRDAARAAAGTPVVNVTDHPDLSAVLLAADVAVLDYSSLRFDWALTGRPAVCFVPDLEQYAQVRPLLAEYGPTAPGPQVTTTDEVLDLVSDLPALTRLAEPDLARVNALFNAAEDGHAAERVVREFFGS